MRFLLIVVLAVSLVGCTKTTKWEDGVVYYKWADTFTVDEQAVILEGMNEWATATGKVSVREAQKGDWQPLMIYKTHKASKASIGYRHNAENYMRLNVYDIYVVTVVHEFGHVIGLKHEHQRPDRDAYVAVHYENILDDYKDQFYHEEPTLYDYRKVPYDYESIMHYDSYAFSKNDEMTIEVLEGTDNSVVWSEGISPLDIERVNLIY